MAKQLQLADKVYSCYEAGTFGYGTHRQFTIWELSTSSYVKWRLAHRLQATELLTRLCADAPFDYKSNNASLVTDVLGTLLLSVLAGHQHYAHMTARRFCQHALITPPKGTPSAAEDAT